MIFNQEPLPDSLRLIIGQQLHQWADTHPTPDEPVLSLMGRDYSPRDISLEFDERTEFGESIGAFLYGSSRRYDSPVETFIGRAIEANLREGR
jgi:hypothetical protein